MALLVCESLALQEASMALAEALLRCERKRFSFSRHPERSAKARSRRISFYGMGSNMA